MKALPKENPCSVQTYTFEKLFCWLFFYSNKGRCFDWYLSTDSMYKLSK